MTFAGKEFGHYRILQLIGKGGMGEVYLLDDYQIQRQVAAKFIYLERTASEDGERDNALRLFQREATAVARLDHPNILALYDHGEAVIDTLQVAYLIMPYRPEGSLFNWLRQRSSDSTIRPLTIKQIGDLIDQASEALQYAHDHQVMHLDVKPANFLIQTRSSFAEYPNLLLTDFGIARLTTMTTTLNQQVRGTPTYMSPEQWHGYPTFASDQYALGIMAYELLAGHPPFQGTAFSVMYAHVHQQPPTIQQENPLLPAAVDPVLQRALAKNPSKRFPSIRDFAQALQQAVESMDENTTLHSLAPTMLPLPGPRQPVQPLSPASLPASEPIPPSASVRQPEQEKLFLSQPDSEAPSQRQLFLSPSNSSEEPVAPVPVTKLRLSPPQKPPWRAGQRLAYALVALLVLAGLGMGLYGANTGKWLWNTAQWPWLSQQLSDVAWSGSEFVAVGDTILSSTDGHNWTTHDIPVESMLTGVIWTGSEFVAVGDQLLMTSADGQTWKEAQTSASLTGVAWSGSTIVAVGDTILTSSDGQNWATIHIPGNAMLRGVIWCGSQFVAVGDNAIFTSSDGSSWASQTVPANTYLSSVAWSGSQFVAVGNGIVLISNDARTWTQQTEVGPQLSGIIWTDSQFIAVGSGIFTSSNGKDWQQQYTNSSHFINGITSASGRLLAVGEYMILDSSDGKNWTSA